MSVTEAGLQQVRGILASPEINQEQLQALKRNTNLCGPDPEPSGFRDGEPFWSKQAIVDWSESTKRSRAGTFGMAKRSMLATLLGREQEREHRQISSIGELAEAVAFEKISVDEADAQCVALRVSASELSSTVEAIQARRSLILDRERAVEARENAERLNAEIDLLDSEIKELVTPRQAKVDLLIGEMRAEEKAANELWFIERNLRDTAPQHLVNEIDITRRSIAEKRGRPDYLRSELDRVSRKIESSESSLDSIEKQLASMVVQQSDYEGQGKKQELQEQRQVLSQDIKSLKAKESAIGGELDSLRGSLDPLQDRLSRLEAMCLDVWPSLTDIEN